MRRRQSGFTMVELMVVVAIAGVLTAVAVPTLRKYLVRARTSEVHENLRKIFDGAAAYFVTERYDRQGAPLVKQYPGLTSVSSWLGMCCQQTGSKCQPDYRVFESPLYSWSNLSFALTDAHYYYYIYYGYPNNTGTNAFFSTRAWGDLDCDDQRSYYELEGRVNAEGDPERRGVYALNPLE